MKILKTITEWPLSKVELVEIDGKKMIKKTIHEDFADEYYRQKFLFENLKFCNIPKVLDLKHINSRVFFLMEYIDSDIKLSHHEIIELINDFHNEAQKLKDISYPVYNYPQFVQDNKTASQYGINLDAEPFREIFEMEQTIVHGDLGKDQLLLDKDQLLYMIDFGRSFFGPGILDIAYYCNKNDGLEPEVYKILGIKGELLDKAKAISHIMQIAWFDLCQTKYIKDHDYTNNEIKKEKAEINKLMQVVVK